MNMFHKIILSNFLFYQSVMAHDFWLSSNNFNPTIGSKITISAQVGQDFVGETLPRIDDWFIRFDQFQKDVVKQVDGELGDNPLGYILVDSSKALMVVYQSAFEYLILPAAKFEKYLYKMGMDSIIEQRQLNNTSHHEGREYYARYAKLLIKPTGNSSEAIIYKKTKLELELVPIDSPWMAQATDFSVYYQGKPLKNGLVRAYSLKNPVDIIKKRTNENGLVTLNLESGNRWMVNSLHMVPARGERMEGGDWESLWASLVFEK
jgi:uncharacterized GH25 family protein